MRVTEVLGGDPDWDQRTVTLNSLSAGQSLDGVLNPQTIIDERVAEGRGAKTLISISRPVLQRLLDGRSPSVWRSDPWGPSAPRSTRWSTRAEDLAATLHFGLLKE